MSIHHRTASPAPSVLASELAPPLRPVRHGASQSALTRPQGEQIMTASVSLPMKVAQRIATQYQGHLTHDGGGWFWRQRPVTPSWVWRLLYLEVSTLLPWVDWAHPQPSLVTKVFDLLPNLLREE